MTDGFFLSAPSPRSLKGVEMFDESSCGGIEGRRDGICDGVSAGKAPKRNFASKRKKTCI